MDGNELDELARRAQGGDHEAFNGLVVALHRPLLIFLARHAADADQADEVIQATWVTVLEVLPRYEPRGVFAAWVKGIARNMLRRELRERHRHQPADVDLLDQLLVGQGLEDLDAEVIDPDLQRLAGCLDKLAPRARQLIERRHLGGVSLTLLARQFKQRAASLAMTLLRARRQLRACLEGEVS